MNIEAIFSGSSQTTLSRRQAIGLILVAACIPTACSRGNAIAEENAKAGANAIGTQGSAIGTRSIKVYSARQKGFI